MVCKNNLLLGSGWLLNPGHSGDKHKRFEAKENNSKILAGKIILCIVDFNEADFQRCR